MKRLFQIIAVICLVNNATAQTYISMRPNWTFNPPQAENSTYEYYVSKGVGNTEKEARADAFVLAVKEAQTRVGVRANSKEIFRAFQTTDQDFNVTANSYKIPMKEVCFFSEKSRDGQIYYHYQLLQVAISGNITPSFKQFTGDCYDFSKAKELREIMKEEYREQMEEDKKRQEQEAKLQAQQEKEDKINMRKQKIKDNLYWEKGKYIAWNIAGTGYPWNLTDGVEFRYGGVLGIGAYLDLGMDFTTKYFINYNRREYETTKVFFHYAGGIKFYLYKGIFLDCGYGTINEPKIEPYDMIDYYGLNIYKSQLEIKNSHGLLFHAGYNLATIGRNDVGFFLSISAGASYDVVNKVLAPSANLKIGVAWNVD